MSGSSRQPVSGSDSESVWSVGNQKTEREIARFNERNEILHWDLRRLPLGFTPSIQLKRTEPAITVNENKQQLSEFNNKPN